jgi:hypothetical protein
VATVTVQAGALVGQPVNAVVQQLTTMGLHGHNHGGNGGN